LLVGQSTSTGPASDNVVGVAIAPSGYISTNRAGVSAEFGRSSSDGDIVLFQKEGTVVGSIGTDNSRFKVKSNSLALYLENESNKQLVWGNVSSVPYFYPQSDNDTNIGYPTQRFKDLYLSGGVQLGAGNNISWGGAYGAGIPTISAGAGFFAFYPNGSTSGETMRIDSSGLVGIGTTLPVQKLSVSGASGSARFSLERSSSNTTGGVGSIQWNALDGHAVAGIIAYGDGNDEGAHLVFNTTSAASSSDVYVSTTERCRIDSSGNLLVGLSSGQDALIHAQAPKATYTDYATVFAGGLDSNNGEHGISLMTAGNGLAGIIGSNLSIDGATFSQSATGRSSAYISLTNTTVAGKTSTITFGGLTKGTTTALPKMTLDGDGNLLVGNTGLTSARTSIYNSGVDALRIAVSDSAASSTSFIACFSDSTTTAYGTLRLNIVANGNVTNSNNSYGAISDEKLKENITDATPKLDSLNQVRVVNYNLISDPENKQLGVIAQELEQIFPNMVEEFPDKDNNGNDLGTTTKTVKYSVFVPMLIKAIQEQQTTIEALTARIEALES